MQRNMFPCSIDHIKVLNAGTSVYLSSKEVMQSSLMNSHRSIEIDRFRNLVFQFVQRKDTDELKNVGNISSLNH